MTDTNHSHDGRNWPLSNICEPHESNDVLLLKKAKTILADYAHRGENLEAAEGERKQDHASYVYQGNLRFVELLRSRHQEYERKSSMEKPLVALDLLKQWRAQTPPGRFIIMEEKNESSAPPLWKDVGDKAARARISKSLKNLSSLIEDSTRTTSTDTSSTRVSSAGMVSLPSLSSPVIHPELQRLDSDKPVPRSVAHSMLPQPAPLIAPKAPLQQSPIPKIIKPQKLGNRRISAQLHAANAQGKLYGRWKEQDQLLQILRDASIKHQSTKRDKKVDFVLIHGPLGVGKSALARTLKNAMADQDEFHEVSLTTGGSDLQPSFFLEAKFEQLMNPNPYQVFIDLCNQFCELFPTFDDAFVEKFQRAVNSAFPGEDMDALIELLPVFGGVIRPDMCRGGDCGMVKGTLETKGAASGVLLSEKVKSYFVKLLRILTSLKPETPTVVLLHDLHWASECSMDILTTLLSDLGLPEDQSGFIVVATIHDGQDPKPHYKREMEKLQARANIQFHNISLSNMKERDVQEFVAETLDCTYDKVSSLSQLLFQMTQGNPMFLVTILPKMQDKGLFNPDEIAGEWKFDVDEIKAQFGSATSVFDLIRMKVALFPEEVQRTFKYAASLGCSQIDMSILNLLSPECYPSHLEMAAEFGIMKVREGSYYFAVDCMRCTIYELVPEPERPSFHLEIARKLWQHLDERQDKEFLYIVLSQLMMGDSLLEENSDRHSVAALCLRAGEMAAKTLGFQTAWMYFEHGINILPSKKLWGRDNYDLSLRLHNAAVEVCYCNARMDLLDALVETVLEHSRVFDDSLLARSTQIFALGSRQRLIEAVGVALDTLKELGEVLPPSPSAPAALYAFRKTKKMLLKRTDESILQMKQMKDRKKLAALQIFNHMFLYSCYSRPYLAVLVCNRMVQITLEHGISDLSSVAFVFYAECLVGGGSIEEGVRYGKLGMKLYKKFKNEAWLPRVWCAYYGGVIVAKERLSASLEPLQYAYRTGLKTGDIEFAMMNGVLHVSCAALSGAIQLPVVVQNIERLATDMQLTGHTTAFATLGPIYQMILNFSAGPDEVHRKAEFLDIFGKETQKAQSTANESVRLWYKYAAAASALMYEDFDLALQASDGIHSLYTSFGYNPGMMSMVLFIECMALLQDAKRGFLRRVRHLRYVKKRLKLLKHWAYMGPSNTLDKYHLLVAEVAAVEGRQETASLNYRSGIVHATSEGRLGIAAIGNERLARFLVERGDIQGALPVLDQSQKLFGEWGAGAKAAMVRTFIDSLDDSNGSRSQKDLDKSKSCCAPPADAAMGGSTLR